MVMKTDFFAILPWGRKIHLGGEGGMIINGCVIYTGLPLGWSVL